jgi:Phage tail tube protein
MALASTSSGSITYLKESTYGITPTAQGRSLRMEGESLVYDISKESTKEINPYCQTSDLVPLSASAQGGVKFYNQYREYDTFFEAIMRGAYTANGFGDANGIKTMTLSFVAGGTNTITDDGVNGFLGLVAGQWINITGAGTNSGVYRIQSRTDDVLTVDSDTPVTTTAAAQAGCVVSSMRLDINSNGVSADLWSYTIEKKISDITQFFVFRGMVPNSIELDLETASFYGGNINFIGKNAVRGTSTVFNPTTPYASQGFSVFNAVQSIGRVFIDNAPLSGTYVKSAKVSISANNYARPAIGELGAVSVGKGAFDIGGSITVYMNDGALYDKAINNTLVSIEVPVYDSSLNGYVYIFKNCKLKVPPVTLDSIGKDCELVIPFSSLAPNVASDKMLTIDRFGVAPNPA